MRISVVTVCCAATVLLAVCLGSCKTMPPAAGPAITEKPVEKPHKKEFTRTGFATELEALLSAGKYDEAIALFDTVPEPDASDLSIQKLKLSVLISAGKLADAGTLATTLEAANPGNTDILYMQAVLALARGDVAARASYLNRIIKIDPANAEALTALGLDYYSKKNYSQAKSLLVKAIAADRTNTEALIALARVYYMEDELPKAGDTLNLAIERDPNNSIIWAERARIKSETNDLPGALKDIEKAVSIDPNIYSHRIDAGSYYITAGKQKEARNAFTEAIRIQPDHYLAYIYRAGLNDDLGNTDEALSDYETVCRLYPQYWYASESLGILRWGKGDWAGARECFVRALQYHPTNASYALMLTLCYYREGKNDEAKAFMAKYLTTLDREKTVYYVCRLFVDRSGDADVLNRITHEKNPTERNRMLFYSAMYYDLFQSKEIAQKYYLEVISTEVPSFFEYRLSKWALADIERDAGKVNGSADGGTKASPARTGEKAGNEAVKG